MPRYGESEIAAISTWLTITKSGDYTPLIIQPGNSDKNSTMRFFKDSCSASTLLSQNLTSSRSHSERSAWAVSDCLGSAERLLATFPHTSASAGKSWSMSFFCKCRL